MYAYKVPRKLQNIYHFIKKASKCYRANTRAFAVKKPRAGAARQPPLHCTVLADSRYLTFVPRKARIRDSLYTKAPLKKSLHTNPNSFHDTTVF